MINLSILISSSEVSGPGGLFDIGATLPLVAIQFLLLMVILNIFLYNPLLTVIDKRNEYILMRLNEASETLAEANKLTTKYEQSLENLYKRGQSEVVLVRGWNKLFLELEVDRSQVEIEVLLDSITKDLRLRKEISFKSLEHIIAKLLHVTFSSN